MMDWLVAIPAFVKVGASFLGMLALYQIGVPLGISILAWAGLLTLWTGTGPLGFHYQVTSFLMPQNYLLLIAIFLLLFFTEALTTTGKMKRTIDALKKWLTSKRLLLGGLPALVGLLPMPGGALFSAPMVASVDTLDEVMPAHKAAINYWFRHVWEYWWPLYPGVLLAIKYSGLPAGLFFLVQMPFTVAAITGGYFFVLRGVKKSPMGSRMGGTIDARNIASTMAPIGLLVAVSVIGSLVLPMIGVAAELANLVSMLIGLVLGLVVVFYGNGAAFKKALRMLQSKNTWLMMALVLGIQAFSGILKCPLHEASTLTLVSQMQQEFMALGIPILLVMAIIPFISGAVTGVAFGFVGASFPIVFALAGHNQPLHIMVATTVFAYGCGYVGMILSPVHVCLVVTNEYFKTRLFSSYRYIVLPALLVFAVCLLWSGVWYSFL
jgi:integral membrane protein (TIGR00529 family)